MSDNSPSDPASNPDAEETTVNRSLIAVLLAAAITLNACGSSNDSSASSQVGPESSVPSDSDSDSTTTTASPEPVAVDPDSIRSFDDLLAAMADALELAGPEEAAAALEELSDEEGDRYLMELFGWTEDDLREVVGQMLSGGEDIELATFVVDGTDAFMNGVIGPTTPADVQSLIDDNPQVTRIVMGDIEGSIDDESNLIAARLVRESGLATHVPADGMIASGGVDFFLAGTVRTFDDGARFGVHSWATTTGENGADLPMDDPQHDRYLDYYAEMGVDEAFYWFTLDAAPPEDIHEMTAAELETYGFAADR